jgi:hypothetical protein
MIHRVLFPYLLRFGPEIAVFWLICAANSLAWSSGTALRWISLFSVLEILSLAWITVRLVLAEDGFRVSGGWRCRPVSPLAGHLAPLALAALVVLVPMGFRLLVLKRMFGPEAGNVAGLFLEQAAPVFGIWCAVAGCLKLYGMLILRGVEGRARNAAWAVLAVLVVPIAAMVGRAHAPDAMMRFEGSSPSEPRGLAPGIRRALPDALDFIGAWNDPHFQAELSEAKILLCLSARGAPVAQGLKVRRFDAWRQGVRVAVRVRAVDLDAKRFDAINRSVPVLRFADGTHATCIQTRLVRFRGSRLFSGVSDWEFNATFVSPLSLPEFTGDPARLLDGLEILWFGEDLNRPVFSPADIGESVRNSNGNEEKTPPFRPQTMAECFERFPWSLREWREVVLPFLLKNAGPSDLPLILEHLEADPRLTEVVARKGWLDESLPALRRLSAGRFPSSAVGFSLLAGKLDASWNADLKALALGSRKGLETWEKGLRGKQGFDWDAYARESWRRRRTEINWLETDNAGEFWLTAFWAAQAGDESAFRHTVEHAARGKPWERKRLEDLLENGEGAALERIRAAGIENHHYDPKSRRWGPL